MPVVNITDDQLITLTRPEGFADKLFTTPWLWLTIIAIAVIILLWKMKGKSKDDPSTKPFHGRDVRRELMQKEYKKRLNIFGAKAGADLEKGTSRVGRIVSVEHDKDLGFKIEVNPKTKIKEIMPDYWYEIQRFKFRKFGLWPWLKAMVGIGYYYMAVTTDAYTISHVAINKRKVRTVYIINPYVHMINDSDVWTMLDKHTVESNRDIVLKADDENIHGSQIDYLRRLAVHSPAVSSAMEKQSHEARLKEEERRSKTSGYN